MSEQKGTQLAERGTQNVLAEMLEAGQMDKYLYSYTKGNQEVCDLNVDGINRLSIACGVDMEDIEIIEDTDSHITVKATAINADGLRRFGMVREPKVKFNKPNEYALQNATSKAQRNAMKALLPMSVVREAIRERGRNPSTSEY